jgi:hypothetical protein
LHLPNDIASAEIAYDDAHAIGGEYSLYPWPVRRAG